MITQGALAVVGEVGLDPLQIAEQFGGLVSLLRRLPGERARRRPIGGRAGIAYFPGLWVDAALVGDGHRFVALPILIRVTHLDS